ncbi:TraB/GumN family protein [Photobacterium japonica]|uniref:TraB/GumN family protein n=1 Tax=Photobacterium japonica TaxID=2910235 RepID=UPI003D11BBBD
MSLSFLKKIFAHAFVLLPFFSAHAAAEPMVWLAEKGDRNFTFLGAIHVGSADFYPLPSAFLQRWQQADALVVEADILQPFTPTLDPTIPATQRLLSSAEQHNLSTLANKLSLPSEPLLQSPPWLSAITLQMTMATQAGLSADKGIDVTLLKRAKAQKLPVMELESLAQQIRLLETLDDHGKDLLLSTINEWDDMQSQLNCLLAAWKAGDEQQLLELVDDSQYDAHTDDVLIKKRNHDWATQLTHAPAYQHGNFVVVVGAMHLFGKQGVPALLAQQGFDVSLLTQGTNVHCK